MRRSLLPLAMLVLGIYVGGSLFSRSLPRSFLAATNCQTSCYRPNDFAGLLVSLGIQQTPSLLPVARETDECLAIKHPRPEGRIHFILFPKRDVRNVMEVTIDDAPFFLGCFALARDIAQQANALNYRLVTNGPRLQHVTYLHFHLVAK